MYPSPERGRGRSDSGLPASGNRWRRAGSGPYSGPWSASALPREPTVRTLDVWPSPAQAHSRTKGPSSLPAIRAPLLIFPRTLQRPRRKTARPFWSWRQELGDQVVRQFLEGGDVRVGILDGVGDRERPLFFPSRRHEYAAVHHVEPRQIGQLAIVVCLK